MAEPLAPRWRCTDGRSACAVRHLDRETAERHARTLGAGWRPEAQDRQAEGITRLDAAAEVERDARRDERRRPWDAK